MIRYFSWAGSIVLCTVFAVGVAAEPKASDTHRQLERVYERTKAARTEADFTAIIVACQQVPPTNTSAEDRAYADRLMVWALVRRGGLRGASKTGSDAALADFNSAIELDPQRAKSYLARAELLALEGRWGEAADDYRSALRLDPAESSTYRLAAWFLATCPDERFRNAQLAVDAAEKARQLAERDDFRTLDTLAAALASQGEFDRAITVQKQAIELTSSSVPQQRAELQHRLDLYQVGKPYRVSLANGPSNGPSQPQNRTVR